MNYEKLMIKYDKHVKIKEKPLKYGFKGLYKNKKIVYKNYFKKSSN